MEVLSRANRSTAQSREVRARARRSTADSRGRRPFPAVQRTYFLDLFAHRAKNANTHAIELARKRKSELDKALEKVYLSRKKEDVLRNKLKKKTEKVVFCELTDVQNRIYEHVLKLPDFDLLRMHKTPCDCGVNRVFFSEYQRMRTSKEQVNYYRRNRDNLVTRVSEREWAASFFVFGSDRAREVRTGVALLVCRPRPRVLYSPNRFFEMTRRVNAATAHRWFG